MTFTRISWWNHLDGSEIIAERTVGGWAFSEREYAGTRWLPLEPTDSLCLEAELRYNAGLAGGR